MNWEKSLVSIVIPAYKAEKYIKETLDSVVNQTWPYIEVFVIDDGSPDNTFEIAKQYECKNITVLKQENSGACVARNKGFQLSKGDYIQFLDADDILSNDKIEAQIKVLKGRSDILAVSPSVHFMDGEDYLNMKPREESFWIHDTDNPVDFLIKLYGGYGERWMVQTSAWLTPRVICEKIGPWNENLLLDQDGEYFARAVLSGKGICTTGGVNYYRRFFAGSNISAKANKRENLESALLALNLKAEYLSKRSQSENLQQALATLYQEIAINAWPMFKDITYECEQKVRKTGKKPDIPLLGGSFVELLKTIFGWKFAKGTKYKLNKLLGR